ncbi:MAG: hypothetical protein ACR2FV_10835 [Ornithinimicrobium sp.]|jgi:hypothetical protein|uniref:hypothetical protein n=1 Tax=Ornithinimicrobium sp. TaxID=1977084 RepID=UPI003D9B27CB
MSKRSRNRQDPDAPLSLDAESLLRLGRIADLSGRSRERYLCVAGLGIPASGTLLDHGVASLLPAAAVIAALLAAFVVMMRRWGLRPSTAPTGDEVLARLEGSWDAMALDVTSTPDEGPDVERRSDLAMHD